ncbi:MAG: oligoendopeptidase F [Clostridia bacterium]|nr:oligoendopeptidase F [Clostridia bacterium]
MAEQKKVLKRSEVPKEYTWATEHFYATDELWYADLEAQQCLGAEMESFRNTLNTSGKRLYEYFVFCDKLNQKFEFLANYALRKSDEDTSNSKYQEMRSKVMSFIVDIESKAAFATPEILAIEDSVLEGFYKECPELKLYERHLTKIRRQKAHVLSDAEERILAAAGEISSAPNQIGSVFRNADLKFPNVSDSEGKSHQLTQGSFIPLMQGNDRGLRKNAFETFYGVFEGFRNTTAAFLDAQVRQLMFYAKARKYNSTLEASLDNTEVPVTVYHNLIKTVNDNMKYMHKYMKLRKKIMGVDELHMYDIYTNMVEDAEKEISFEEAKATCLEGLAPLGEKYLDMLREGFSNRWIDVYENEGKRGGAYSSAGDPHPFVLLNHKDTLDSMFTLAHEMGHALHTYHSNLHQPPVYKEYVIFVAEVASTCNEVLLMRHLLSKTQDKQGRAYLINYFLEQFRTTLYRQTMFAEFELRMNEIAEAGGSLTADTLCNEYYKLNKKYYGDDMVVDDYIKYEWERIPHFFFNYYVFQYATGFSAAVAIANRILSEGQPAVDDYLKFLSSGSSQDPISLLKIAGVDMTTAKPVEDALKLFGELIDEMDELMSK